MTLTEQSNKLQLTTIKNKLQLCLIAKWFWSPCNMLWNCERRYHFTSNIKIDEGLWCLWQLS